MNFASIGSVNTYLKSMDMQNKWQTKRRTGDFSADGKMSVSEWIKKQTEQSRKSEEQKKNGNDRNLSGIRDKVSQGKRLTSSEEAYLRTHDPDTYEKMKDTERLRSKFERELKSCKTKEDVRRLRMAYCMTSLGTIKSVKNNPNISDEKKAELISDEQRKMAVIDDTAAEFVKSGQYSKLPTEAERIKAEKLLAEAARTESKSKNTVQRKVLRPAVHYDENGRQETKKEKEPVRLNNDDGITRAEAERSPEVRKVRRAKLSAAGSLYKKTAASAAAVTVKKAFLDAKA